MTSAQRFDNRGSRVGAYPTSALPWPSVRALPARGALDRALAVAGPVPCQRVEPAAWTSDDPENREIAALYCAGCPVMSECREVSRTEHFGVWAGIDRTTKENEAPVMVAGSKRGRSQMISLEALKQQSDGFGRRSRPTPVEEADPNTIDFVGYTAITEADVKRLGIDPADYPGVIVLNSRGRAIFPPPPSVWDPITRKIINPKENPS